MGVILKNCPGQVLLSLPVTAFKFLRDFFFRCDWIAYLVPMECSFLWLLLATPFAISFPQHWPTQPLLAFASDPLPCAPLSFPICALGFLPLALLPGGVPIGQLCYLLPFSPFHLHCFILFPVFFVTGILPCKCKAVNMEGYFTLEVNLETERVGDGNIFLS